MLCTTSSPGRLRGIAAFVFCLLLASLVTLGEAHAEQEKPYYAYPYPYPASNESPDQVKSPKPEPRPGPEALYDPNQGEPEALTPPPVRGTVFPGLQPPWRGDLAAARQRLYDQHGITFSLSYQQMTQYASETLTGARKFAIAGWAAPGMTWTPLNRGTDWEGSLVLRMGWRGPLGANPWPAVFGPMNIGSAWSTYEFTSWNGNFVVEDLFWEQRLGPDFSFRIGNQAPQATINTFRFKDARVGFTASPLAFHETIPYPAFGAGLSFRARLGDSGFFVNGVLNDMNGNPGVSQLDWSHLRSSQLFSGIEVGKIWRRSNGEFDLLSINVFHAGTRNTFNPLTTPNAPGGGFKINAERQFGRIVSFASYTYNEARGGGISTTFSGNTAYVGAALLRPFGINGEVAAAVMWTRPFNDIFPGSGQRDQYGVDAYWNIALTPNTTITPGLQLIFNPAFNPNTDFVAVPHLKFRTAL